MSTSTKLELFRAAATRANSITNTSVEKVASIPGSAYATVDNGDGSVIHGAFMSQVDLSNLKPIHVPKAKGARPTSALSVVCAAADPIEIEVEGIRFRVKQIRMDVSLVVMGQAESATSTAA